MEIDHRQRGDIDAAVLFLFVIAIQIFNLSALTIMLRTWQSSLDSLSEADEAREIAEIQAFGESWPAPYPRIDYGAYYQKNRDAEAICIVGRASLSENDLGKLRCE